MFQRTHSACFACLTASSTAAFVVIVLLLCHGNASVSAQTPANSQGGSSRTAIEEWIQQLGSDDYDLREEATRTLRQKLRSDSAGVRSFLEDAAQKGGDAEIRERAKSLLGESTSPRSQRSSLKADSSNGERVRSLWSQSRGSRSRGSGSRGSGSRGSGLLRRDDFSKQIEDEIRQLLRSSLRGGAFDRIGALGEPPNSSDLQSVLRSDLQSRIEEMQREVQEVRKKMERARQSRRPLLPQRGIIDLRDLQRELNRRLWSDRDLERFGADRNAGDQKSGDQNDRDSFDRLLRWFTPDVSPGVVSPDDSGTQSSGRVQIWQNGQKVLDRSFGGDGADENREERDDAEKQADVRLQLRALPPVFSAHFDIAGGVMVETTKGLKLKRGDVVLSVDGKDVHSVVEFVDAVRLANGHVGQEQIDQMAGESTAEIKLEVLRKGLRLEIIDDRAAFERGVGRDFQARPIRSRSRVR